jgi:hypothetical protein
MNTKTILLAATIGLGSFSTLIIAAALSLSAFSITAQEDNGGPRGPRFGPGAPRLAPPIIAALDVNKDGRIDANEIANAANALKTLDKNRDGELTPDEFGLPRPSGQRGGPRGGPGQPLPPREQ